MKVQNNNESGTYVKVLPDTGSSPSNSVREKIVGWIEQEEIQFLIDCYLSTNEHHEQTTVSLMAWTGAHSVISN